MSDFSERHEDEVSKDVFRPERCPECKMDRLVYEQEQDTHFGHAYCPTCRAAWTTEVKPRNGYATLGYQMHRGEVNG